MLPKHRLGGAEGIAILEVLIAGVVLAIAIIGLALMFSSGQSLVVAEGDERVSIYLAQQKIERLRALLFRCIPVGITGDAVGPEADCPAETQQDYNEDGAELGFPGYRRTTVVQCADPDTFAPRDPCPDPVIAKRITVTVDPEMTPADTIIIGSVVTLH